MKTATWIAAITALTCVGSLQAHHSSGMFDQSKVIWVKGTVVRYEPINPHAMIILEQRSADGQLHRMTVEGPALNRLDDRSGKKDFLKAGDVIEVCGFPFREDILAARPSLPLHGHMLVLPDGKMRGWGPYGKLENCIRPGDQPQAWVDFVNTDPLAWRAWCRGRALVTVATKASGTFVDEINRRMATPCN